MHTQIKVPMVPVREEGGVIFAQVSEGERR